MNQKSGATDKKSGAIVIKGARANNLKGIDVTIPRGKLVVITGVSGSGKSSLAFDTLFAEGQRRFAESLSSFARQFLGRMSKPAAESITGIPPAIAIEQKVTSKNPRSTVGTVTECYDYLRLLYAKIGRTYSPISGVEVKCESVKDVVEYLCSRITAKVLYLTADTGLNTPDARIERLLNLRQAGYSRVLALPAAQGASNLLVARIDEILRHPEQWQQHSLYALIDRYLPQQQGTLSADLLSRMQDSAKSAFELGEGRLQVVESGSQSADSETPLLREFSNRFEADGILFEEPSEQMFSYNSPVGACPRCGGFGSIEGIDEGLVIPNASLSIYEGAIACWRGEVMSHFKDELVLNAQRYNISIHKPYLLLSKEEKRLIWEGTEHFTGIAPFFKMVEKQRYKIQYKYMLSRYQGRTVCPECEGSRLKRETKYVKISGRDISQLMNMSISSLLEFLDSIHLEPYEMEVAGLALKELKQRLNCICQVGLGYLTLNRGIKGLSGGESQRIHLVSAIGSSLVGSLYILDEPSIGLHPRDTLQLIGVLKRLRDLGNTVVIVEHDLEIIRNADYLIDIGPLAGQHGGEVVFQGDIATALSTKEYGKSLTLRYLQGVERLNSALLPASALPAAAPHTSALPIAALPAAALPALPAAALPALHSAHPVRSWRNCIELKGCMEHNLKDIDVKIPLGVLTVITGVSGSGKSSLVSDILYPALSRHFNIVGDKPGAFRELGGDLKLLSGVEYVDQNPIGKSSRSNPVTYLKIYDDIRRLFSEQPYAKLNNYTPSSFSFNIDGGRCPQCLGDGYITIPMQFMADVTMVCEECGGKRFKSDLLEVRYQGKNISDVLDMSVSEAIEFFSHREEAIALRIARSLQILERVGLGYLKLGQSSSTLSGGESQRVKLAQFLSKENGTGGTLFIFDEPTTGLHLHDIKNLISSINALIERGNSVVVVEHNVEVMRSADWIIDMGPDGGDQGGRVVFAGKVADLAKLPDNYTAAALASQQ